MLNPYLELVLVSFIFGSAGSFVKIINLPPTTITFFRMAVPTIIVYFYLRYRNISLFAGGNRLILLASFLNAIRLLFYFIAFTLATVGNATLVSSLGPVFIFIYSHYLLHERITKFKFLLLLSAIIGVVILYSNKQFSLSNHDFLGMGFALLSSAIYNLTIVVFKKELDRYTKTETIFYQNVIGTFIFLPFLFINRPWPTAIQLTLSVFSQFMIGLVAFVLFFSALKKVSASVASIAMFDNIISVALGVILFKEVLSVNMVIGGILIILSSLLISRNIHT